ncbi:MAG: dephospho-CoA kinase [Actinobacteria bacterium]|nr:dephospho-CoA kinase [Actinomycetota bacterium]
MKIVGITGSIGSGKSTVASLLKEKGALVINADQIARDVTEPNKPAWKEIVAHFGESVLKPDRNINRRELGKIVFADLEKMAFLEKVIHPRVIAEIKTELEGIEKKFENGKVVVLDVPLLFEVGLNRLCNTTVVVTAEEGVRLKRLLDQGLSRDEAEMRVAAQRCKESLEKLADIVIKNNGTLTELKEKVKELWERMNR